MKVVFILIDAFRSDYLSKETTPYLYSIAKSGQYFKEVISSAGYCERTEIFTGMTPKESGFFTAIGYDPQNSPYRKNRALNFIGMIERLSMHLFNKFAPKITIYFRKLILRLFYKSLFANNYLKPYNIPFSWLKYFNLTEDSFDHHQNDKFNSESLFAHILKMDKTFYYDAFTSLRMMSNGNDANRFQMALKEISKNNPDFIPIYFSNSDVSGHKYGPESMQMKIQLTKIDKEIKEFISKALSINKQLTFVLLGDHGMSTVKKNIDIVQVLNKIIKTHKINVPNDFIYFLDSTLFRMWFFNKKTKELIISELNKEKWYSQDGILLDAEIANKYHLPINDRRYGDLIWWANEGVQIFPDFFHSEKPYKGMHGYQPLGKQTSGMCIIYSQSINQLEVPEINLNDIYSLLKDLLNE